MKARLAVYTPDGDRTGYLEQPASWSLSLPINALGAMTLAYPASAQGANLLTSPCEIAIEIWDGKNWHEPANGRYLKLEYSGDQSKRAADQPSYQMPGYGQLLEGVAVIPAKFGNIANYDADGKRKMLSATPGQIVHTILREARNLVDNLVPGLKLGFTPTHDSKGKAWSTRNTLYYEPGLSLLTIIDNLGAQGRADWWLEGRTLHMVNPDSTATQTPVVLSNEPESASVRTSIAGLLHTVLLRGEEQVWRIDNKGAPTPWGTSMKIITQGGVRDERTARDIITPELQAGARERTEYQWTAPAAALAATPCVDFVPGDWVRAPGKSGLERMRVFQIQLQYATDGITVALTLNDRFEDSQVRAAKRTKGIVNGASGDAGTSTLPANAKPANARPAAPEGLVATSVGYWNGTRAESYVRANWSHSGFDVHGVAVNIREFEVNIGGRTTTTPDWSATLEGYAPGHTVDVTVIAISEHGVRSAPARARLTTSAPDEVPPPPTKPILSGVAGVVTVKWDGKLQAPGQSPVDPPEYFSHIEIQESNDSFSWTTIATIPMGSIVLDRQELVGTTIHYRAIAVTRNGIKSDPGPDSSILVENLYVGKLQEAFERQQDLQISTSASISRVDAILEQMEKAKADRDELNAAAEAAASAAADGVPQQLYRPQPPTDANLGTAVGDTWIQHSPFHAGRVVAEYWWSGVSWIPKFIASDYIESVEAHKLRASKAGFNEAFVNDLFVNHLRAKVGEFNRITVAPQNAIRGGMGTIDYAPGTMTVSDDVPVGSGAYQSLRWTDGEAIIFPKDGPYRITVDPDRDYVLSFWTKSENPKNVYMYMRTYPNHGDKVVSQWQTLLYYWETAEWQQHVVEIPKARLRGPVIEFSIRQANGPSYFAGWTLTPKASTVHIEDGAITGSKITVDEAFANRIVASRVTAGVVESDLFKSRGEFGQDGISISSNGIWIRTTDRGQLFMDGVNGLRFLKPVGGTSFWIKTDGSALFEGDITSGSTISGSTISGSTITGGSIIGTTFKTGASGTRIEIDSVGMRFYDGSRLTAQMGDFGTRYWYGSRLIGSVGEGFKHGNTNIRGISNQLERTGDYITWAYRVNASDKSFTSMLTLDPRGTYSGRRGIVADLPLWVDQGIAVPRSGGGSYSIKFTTIGVPNHSAAPAILFGRTGIAFTGNTLWLIQNNTAISLTQLL